eukprot:260219_1
MAAASKIPPHIARELRRHVRRPSRGTSTTRSTRQNNSNSQGVTNIRTLVGCTAFVGVTASIPFIAMQWIGPLNEKDDILSAAQIRRGAFNNSGSRDAGKDPNWDFKTGTRRNNPDYEDMFLKDNPQELEHGDKYVYESKRSGAR